MSKKKIIFLTLSIFLVISVLLSSSYALLFKTDITDKQSYTTGVLDITSETLNGSITINNQLPMTDSDGANTTPYIFRITNTGNLNYKFNVMLLSTTTENQIEAKYIKIKVDDNEITKLSDLTDGIILSDITLKPNDYIDISLRVWLDENTPNTQIGKTFNAKITTEGQAVYTSNSLDKSGANSPDLVQGLIPVMYNGSKWVKADATNTNETYKWYDYDNKLWANAVLVKESDYDYIVGYGTLKNVHIDSGTKTGTYINSNQGISNSTSEMTLTLKTGKYTDGFSFNYAISSDENDKFIVTINGTEVLNKSGKISSTNFYYDVASNKTYNIVMKYIKDSSNDIGTDTVTISNLSYPGSATLKIEDNSDYPFEEQCNHKIGSGFIFDESTGMFTLSNISNNCISSRSRGSYICPDITQSSCSKILYIVTSYVVGTLADYETGNKNGRITQVYEIYSIKNEIRDNYQKASAGTAINESDIIAYYVWIPRYKYKVWNISKQAGTESTYAYNAYTEGIDIKFEHGKESTGTINCTYNFNVDSANGGIDLSTTTAETCTGRNGDYYTHPAFTFGTDELRGFWISKFEMSSSDPSTTYGGGNVTNLTVRSLPNKNSWRYITVGNINTVIQNMQISNNIYGLSTSRTNTDSHMIKNMEWGAVAYLTNSNYGRCTNGTCTEVTKNNCDQFITGIGGDTISALESSTSCTNAANKYNGAKGMLASTTGNITGVYDMNGGTDEYVMSNMSSVISGYTFYPLSSGLTSTWYNGNEKYLDAYAYDTNDDNQQAYNRGKLGDATSEVTLKINQFVGGWYGNMTSFIFSNYAWFERGETFRSDYNSGIFTFGIGQGGLEGSYETSRMVLTSISN